MTPIIKKLLTFVFALTLSSAVLAETNPTPDKAKPIALKPEQPPKIIPSAPSINARAYILLDAKTGKIIAEQNANEELPPASLTKLMTLYVVANALKDGQIKPDEDIRISENAWRTGGSRMFVKVNSLVPASDLIKGVIIASGNDATIALAERIAGTAERFVEMMNQQAQTLGMKNTEFFDPAGLSDKNHTTPYDLSILARALIENFPEDYKWYKEKWITYNNIKQPNRNRLLWHDDSVDGLKTGHTSTAGFCLVASAKKQGMRLISVVMGAPTDNARINDSGKLIDYGFRYYATYRVYADNETVAQTRVWLGKNKMTPLGVMDGLYVTIASQDEKNLKTNILVDKKIKAPLEKGQACGSIELLLNGKVIEQRQLVALEANPKAGFFARMLDHIRAWF